ncbi:Uma2 family endonuclease [Allokutzneria sp. A3M-2-11 16]|uniref:Uma2 family endonuclease n=1 Tax=Allokutzneria sp. A3M-2-11 16 TaxID=2962043 RepID=UPI0020B7E6E4|nr:Uma2 family endonuclease [Allokutzneria sp. A3M-2-11 16]MCP3799132.1 Uma2 family endonuclease [Allokutzneria sp. A3M-2-11 16]
MAFPPPDHLLTIEEYAALGETEDGYTELHEGRLLMSPSPSLAHNAVCYRLAAELEAQLPDDLAFIQDLDVNLELAPPGEPGFVRRPDLMVVDSAAWDQVEAEGGLLRAADVRIVVEIVSPGSRRTDYVAKRQVYAEAGIPHCWIIDIEHPVSLTSYSLSEEFSYVDSQAVTGTFTAAEPFPVRIDLERLRRRKG